MYICTYILSNLFTTTCTTGSTTRCFYDQVAVVTSTLCTETSKTVPNMCVVVGRVALYQVTSACKEV